MHSWRLGFGSVLLAVSAVSWLGRSPAPHVAPAQVGNDRCLAAQAASRVAPQAPLQPLQAQALPERTVKMVDAPVEVALRGAQPGHAGHD